MSTLRWRSRTARAEAYPMGAAEDFRDVMERLRRGDQGAAAEIFRRYVHRLTALASRQFAADFRDRADPEGVVQSVYRSFFARDLRKQFDLDDWEGLWALLAVITVRKCTRRRRRFRDGPSLDADWYEAIDRGPTPLEAAALTELVGRIFLAMEPDEREIAEGILQGCTAVEIADRVGCSERTVRRLRVQIRQRVERMETESDESR